MGVEVAIASAAAMSKVTISNGHCTVSEKKLGDETMGLNVVEPGFLVHQLAALDRFLEKISTLSYPVFQSHLAQFVTPVGPVIRDSVKTF